MPSGIEGYWYYQEPPEPAPPLSVKPPVRISPVNPQKNANPCEKAETWNTDCGFVLPDSFAMQAKERDALLQGMVMNPGNPKAVEAVQEYTRWILHQAMYASSVWHNNAINNPEKFDPAINSPISQMGLRLSSMVETQNHESVWRALREQGAFLVLFTKNSCDYCHAQVAPLSSLVIATKLKVWDASLEGPCLDHYKNACVPPDKATLPARILHVKTVPSVFVYIPHGTWIRVSTGLATTDVMKARLYNLFVSWKVAATDSRKETGKTGLALDPSSLPKTTQQLKSLLNKQITGTDGKKP